LHAGEVFTWKVWVAQEDVSYNVIAEYMTIGTNGVTDEQFFATDGYSGVTVIQSDTWVVLQLKFQKIGA